MADLSIKVLGYDIVVQELASERSITYRKVPDEPLLMALESMRKDPTPQETAFLSGGMEGRLRKSKSIGLAMISPRWLFGHCTSVRTTLRAPVSHEACDVYFWSEADLITPRSIGSLSAKNKLRRGLGSARRVRVFYLRYLGTP